MFHNIEEMHIECSEIRNKKDLLSHEWDGIVLPGGESTTMGKLLVELDMFFTLKEMILGGGIPTLATCAGMILLAKSIEAGEAHMQVLDVEVVRNGYGRQLGSFKSVGDVGTIEAYPMVFIRAPYISKIGSDVEVLVEVDRKIVGVKSRNITAYSFHPELTKDGRVHREFVRNI